MREIKFRVFDGRNNPQIMREIVTLEFLKNGSIAVWCKHLKHYMVVGEDCPLMQFTGLLDKNGKKIFEGDIIKVTGEFAIDDYGIVKWSQQEDDYTYHCGFMVDWQEEVKRRSHLSFWANHRLIEIIGNIYENPELLKQT